jgi:hypothetical protein
MMGLVGLFAFMLVPVWIPVIGSTLGYLADLPARRATRRH